MPSAGIYQILNKTNGKRYVGSTINLHKRWQYHRYGLRHGTHDNAHLQAAWNLYGGQAFAFAVLEYVPDRERLTEREQHYFDVLQPEYNIAPIADNPMVGRTHTEETKRKMSEAQMGKVFSEKHKRKLSEAHEGYVHSEETRRKMSEARKGRVHTTETKRKMSEALSGERGPAAKLTEQDVREVKALLQESALLQRAIAARYGVSRSAICDIKHGRAWSYISVDAPTG